MVKNISIKQIYTETLGCEPLLERCPNGELLCICGIGGVGEPSIFNRVVAFHSKDNGETWFGKENIYPEDGTAVMATELNVNGNEITAYVQTHDGRHLDWKCHIMKSYDNGYTWKNTGAPQHFPEYTFIRKRLVTSDGRWILPYQTYPVTKEEYQRVLREENKDYIFSDINKTNVPYCENGVLISNDNGVTFERYMACRMNMGDYGWIWAEPTVAELSDGTIVMLIRKDRSGWLWRCESHDGGKTWGECVKTDIPNPGNKPVLYMLDKGRIALVHTPNNKELFEGNQWGKRWPLELWISDDDMRTWNSKSVLTDFPGSFDYNDGFYEDGHLHFVIEHNRHTHLYFNVTV